MFTHILTFQRIALDREPRQDEIFFAQYAKKNENGELQQWVNRKAENAYVSCII